MSVELQKFRCLFFFLGHRAVARVKSGEQTPHLRNAYTITTTQPETTIMAVSISTLDRFKLETAFGDSEVVQTTYEWEFSKRRAMESTWKEVKLLGAGAFGSVWLEKKTEGGQLRAVKKLRRECLIRTGFSQEIIALVTVTEVRCSFRDFYRADVF